MTISALSILVDGTVATTGGTATGVISKGNTLDQNLVVMDDGSEFVAQSTVQFSIKDPKVNSGSPNGYTQAKSSVKLKVPLLLDNLAYTMNTLGINLSIDPETSDAEIATMLVNGAQLLIDAALSDFWKKQSLS